jgi:hypothetical protein
MDPNLASHLAEYFEHVVSTYTRKVCIVGENFGDSPHYEASPGVRLAFLFSDINNCARIAFSLEFIGFPLYQSLR